MASYSEEIAACEECGEPFVWRKPTRDRATTNREGGYGWLAPRTCRPCRLEARADHHYRRWVETRAKASAAAAARDRHVLVVRGRPKP